jgi:hypothetical protein
MEPVKIDPAIVSPNYKHTANHKVEYFLYEETGKKITLPKTDPPGCPITGVCFSELINNYVSKKQKPNKVFLKLNDDLKSSVKLNLEEKKGWIKTSRRYKMLPHYVKYEWVNETTNLLVLDISKIQPALLYLYLCNFRYLREDPGFVRAVLHLVNKKKLNFFLAYLLASRVCTEHSGHSVMPDVRNYVEQPDPNNVDVNIGHAFGLLRFIKDPAIYDGRFMQMMKDGNSYGWNCTSTIIRASFDAKMRSRYIFLPEIKQALLNDDKAKILATVKELSDAKDKS